jgi:rare lipoprotein A
MPERSWIAVALVVLLAACGTTTKPPPSAPVTTPTPTPPSAPSTKYYLDDGPGANPPANLDTIPDAVPRAEPLHRFANRPYTVLGRDYVPATALKPYRERGVASWYGRKFHGQKTATGEVYDMYAMTAAHPTLPLPSYVRVTNVATGASVVVRVNDRGPFLHSRVIDLSYAAAHRIGVAQRGSGEVEVVAVLPGDVTMVAAVPAAPASASAGLVTRPLEAPPPVTAAAVAVAPVSPAAIVEPAPRTDVAAGAPAGGFVVQLGAFGNYANAQSFLAHAQAQLAAAQVDPKVRQLGGLFRVYVGPFADRAEALRNAERIERAFGMPTAIAPH